MKTVIITTALLVVMPLSGCAAAAWFGGTSDNPFFMHWNKRPPATTTVLRPTTQQSPSAHEVRIAVGQDRAETVALIEGHGGTDITPGLEVVGPNGEWPLHGLYWEFRDYDAVIMLAARDGKIVTMSFWTKDDFGEHGKSHRYAVERSIAVLKLDTETRRVSVEGTNGDGSSRGT